MSTVGDAPVAARTDLLARLRRRADEALRGIGGLVMLTGEAGIGKTSVLAALASHVRGRARVRWGRGFPGAPGYWPWREALGDFAAVAALAADDAADGTDTFRLWQDVTAALLDAGEPVVLLLDDLHWADPASLRLLDFLARRLASAPVLVVGAARPPSPVADASEVPLGGLSPAEVGDLVAGVLGGPVAPDQVALIARRTGGNPFFVRQLALLWPEVSSVPAGIAAVLSRRLAALSPAAAERLDAASVYPGPIPAAAIPDPAELIAAGILTGAGPYEFCHDLFRSFCYQRLDPAARLDRHDEAARLLSAAPAGPAPDIAHHLLRGHRPADAVPHLVRAAEAATATMAYDEAVEHWTAVASLSPPRPAVLLSLGAAQRRAGELTAAADTFARAASLAASSSPAAPSPAFAPGTDVTASSAAPSSASAPGTDVTADSFARAVLGLAGLHAQTVRQSPHELVQRLREALARSPSPPLWASLLAALARVLAWSGIAMAEARELAAEGRDIARRIGDPDALRDCELAVHNVLWAPGTARERLAIAPTPLLRASDLLELGDPAFRPLLGEVIAAGEASRQPREVYAAMLRRAMLAVLDGRPEAAEMVERAYGYGTQIGQRDAADARLAQLWPLRAAQGALPSLAGDVDVVFPDAGEPAARVHRILLRIASGDLAGARAQAAPMRDGDLDAVPRNAGWLVAMAYLADIATGLPDPALAAAVYARLLPYAGTIVVIGAAVACLGPVDAYLARLAAPAGQPGQAGDHRARAVARYAALGVPEPALATGSGRAPRAALVGPAMSHPAGPLTGTFHRDGGRWTVGLGSATARLRHAKGLADLAVLLAAPGRPVPAIDLAAAAAGEQVRAALGFGSDPIMDARGRHDLRARLRDLAEPDREAVLSGLRQATGLGGRSRRLGDPAERARKAVTARIRDAVARIAAVDPALGRHLADAVTTGSSCTYSPAEAVRWRF